MSRKVKCPHCRLVFPSRSLYAAHSSKCTADRKSRTDHKIKKNEIDFKRKISIGRADSMHESFFLSIGGNVFFINFDELIYLQNAIDTVLDVKYRFSRNKQMEEYVRAGRMVRDLYPVMGTVTGRFASGGLAPPQEVRRAPEAISPGAADAFSYMIQGMSHYVPNTRDMVMSFREMASRRLGIPMEEVARRALGYPPTSEVSEEGEGEE